MSSLEGPTFKKNFFVHRAVFLIFWSVGLSICHCELISNSLHTPKQKLNVVIFMILFFSSLNLLQMNGISSLCHTCFLSKNLLNP